MSATATIQLRIDPKEKEELKLLFKQLGLTLSGGTKQLLNYFRRYKTIPKQELTENGWSPEFEKELLADIEWTKKHGKRYDSVESVMKSLLDD